MNEQEYIAILWKFVGGSIAIAIGVTGAAMRWLNGKLENAATKAELAKVEADLHADLQAHVQERQRRDDQVDKKLDKIDDSVTGIHKRIDQLFQQRIER